MKIITKSPIQFCLIFLILLTSSIARASYADIRSYVYSKTMNRILWVDDYTYIREETHFFVDEVIKHIEKNKLNPMRFILVDFDKWAVQFEFTEEIKEFLDISGKYQIGEVTKKITKEYLELFYLYGTANAEDKLKTDYQIVEEHKTSELSPIEQLMYKRHSKVSFLLNDYYLHKYNHSILTKDICEGLFK